MKFFLLLVTFFCSVGAMASDETILSCKLAKLHDSGYFEGSLSLDEYPDIDVIKNTRKGLRISIGGSLYQDEDDGWVITVVRNAIGGRVYHIVNKTLKTDIALVIAGVPGRESGRILVTENKKKIGSLLAFVVTNIAVASCGADNPIKECAKCERHF